MGRGNFLSDCITSENLERLLAGDERAFWDFHNRCKQRIFRLCYNILQDPVDAEEAALETFVRIWKNRERLRKKLSFSSWVARIAVNCAKDIAKRRKREITFSELRESSFEEASEEARPLEEEIVDPKEDLEEGVIKKAEKEFIRKKIMELDIKSRTVIALVYYEGLKEKEAAEILGRPVGTVKSRLNRALEKLRKKLEGKI